VSTAKSALDAEELLHFALRSMESDQGEDAIVYLKRALTLAPNDGRLHFLLGAIHAELGLEERAIAEYGRATQLAPELLAAHFQLGTLLLKRGDLEQAKQAWQPIDMLQPDHPMSLFKSALMHLASGDYARCIAELKQAIARSDKNDALYAEMGEVLARTEALMAGEGEAAPAAAPLAPQPSGSAAPPDKGPDPHHVLLAGYEQPAGSKL